MGRLEADRKADLSLQRNERFGIPLPARRCFSSTRRPYDGGGSFQVVGDRGEAHLQRGLGQSLPSHATESVAALPGPEDLLDSASHAVDGVIPVAQLLFAAVAFASPHVRGNDAWHAASLFHRWRED